MQPRQVGASRLRELETSPVPPRALLISLLALAVAAAGNWFWPERLPDYFALFWLLALIPPFLLAYYRGWEGAALALAAGMILLIGVEVGGSYLSDRQVRWWIVGAVILVGHSAGDEVLRMVGEVLAGNTRAVDLSGRYGGDEFLALLPGERAIGAVSFAQRVRAAVAKAELAGEEGITLSGGVAAYDPGIETTDKPIDAADRALYAAKRAGGNRIVVNAEARDPGELEGEDVLLLRGRLLAGSGGRRRPRGGPSGRLTPAGRPSRPRPVRRRRAKERAIAARDAGQEKGPCTWHPDRRAALRWLRPNHEAVLEPPWVFITHRCMGPFFTRTSGSPAAFLRSGGRRRLPASAALRRSPRSR